MNSADAIVNEMTERLKKIQGSVGGGGEDVDEESQANPTSEEMEVDPAPQAEPAAPKEVARGWRLLTSAEWTPRPVGVF